MKEYRYAVFESPGCHREPHDPIVSRHETLSAALQVARKSDRVYAMDLETEEKWQIPQQNDPELGSGCFGNGITPAAARELGWPL